MSGDSLKTPRHLRLQALTVSVNYADFLECIAPNRRHFERWLVVTVESDLRTLEVCRVWGMEVLFSRRLHQNGAKFHKAAALNEGLAALDQDAWTVVIDSDILLPSDFRERLELQALESNCLYGISGRRICQTLREFRHLSAQEPWAENLLFSTFVIGYFHLFYMGQRHNRYPEGASTDASGYDLLFSQEFPGHLHRYLPFTALHAGAPSVNWQGRTSEPFFPEEGAPWQEPVFPDQVRAIAAATGGPSARGAVLGVWRGEVVCALSEHFVSIQVVDHWGLIAPTLTPAAEADRLFLLERFTRETEGLPGLQALKEHSSEVLDSIPDSSLDLLWISPEMDYDFLLLALPAWVPKLRAGGAVAGGFYDAQTFPGTVSTVHLLLGKPDAVLPGGQWMKRIARPSAFGEVLSFPVPPYGGKCVAYVCLGQSEVEGLLVSLSSLKEHWNGPVSVICPGDEEPSLRMACARLGVHYQAVPAAPEGFPPVLARLAALEWALGDEILLLGNSTLVLGPPDALFNSLASADAVFPKVSPVLPAPVLLECFLWKKCTRFATELMLRAVAFQNAVGLPVIDAVLAGAPDGAGELTAELVWSGASRRTPETCAVLILHRLARAGAQRALPVWDDAARRLMARLAEEC